MFEGVISVKAAEGSEGNAVALTVVILVWKQTQSVAVILAVGAGIKFALKLRALGLGLVTGLVGLRYINPLS